MSTYGNASLYFPAWPPSFGGGLAVAGDFDTPALVTPTMQFDDEANSQLLAVLEDF